MRVSTLLTPASGICYTIYMENTAKKALLKNETYYYTGKPCSKGHVCKRIALNRACHSCTLEIKKKQDQKHQERIKKYLLDNKEIISQKRAEYYLKNREKIITQQPRQDAAYYAKFQGRLRAKSMKRHAQKLKAIPKWADLKAIREFYKKCPEGYHVDHIVPLQGKTVSGFHVLENLQYLPAKENLSKGNKLSR